ncbi:hypothetical protein Tco_0654949 [Tanacetum coccineum]|uniref:Uncharacterized protein n=1 Tax=Tanacetum coccineum TaxID=301880 RepID=A0ABQ4X4Q3_9ASTR
MSQTQRKFKRGQDTKIPHSSGPPKKVDDEAVHKELGDRMERVATTASSLEAEQDIGSGPRCQDTILGGVDAQTRTLIITSSIMANLEFYDTHNMVAYLLKPEGSEDFQQIFWQTASTRTLEDGEVEITATIDGQLKTITEASLIRHLKLEDADGISSLPNTEIFEQLALMGYASDSDKLTFQKGHFSPQWRFLIHIILHCLSPKKTAWEQFSSNIATAIIFLAINRTFNFSKMIFEGMVGYKQSHFKGMSYEDIRLIFKRVWDQNHAFVPKDSKIEKEVMKRHGFDFQQRSASEFSMDVVPRDELAIDVVFSDGSSKNYKIFSEMLDDFDRQDVMDLHRLVQERIHILLTHTGIAIHMMIKKKYPLTQEMISRMLSRRLEVDQESEMAFELLRFIRKSDDPNPSESYPDKRVWRIG